MALGNALKKNRSAKSGAVATKASKSECKWCAIGECWGCKATRGKVQGGRQAVVKGKGKGKVKGKMMWVPVPRGGQRAGVIKKMGKLQKNDGKKGRSRSQRAGSSQTSQRAPRAAPAMKIWLAGLPEIEDREERKEASTELQEQFNNTLDCKFAEIWKNGHGYAIFGSEQDVQVALETFAGSNFRGNVIEVDVWEKASK